MLKFSQSVPSTCLGNAPQVIYGFSHEGGIPKVIANKLAVGGGGEWLLPFWRENDVRFLEPNIALCIIVAICGAGFAHRSSR